MSWFEIGCDDKGHMNYAEVYIDIKTFEVSYPFDYIIPESLSSEIKTGSVVYVHFNNRKELGYVTRVKNTTSVQSKDLKHIDEVCSGFSLFNRTRLRLIFWMSTYFFTTGTSRQIKQSLKKTS